MGKNKKGQHIKFKANVHNENMVDAIREMLGLEALYNRTQKNTLQEMYLVTIGDGNRRSPAHW